MNNDYIRRADAINALSRGEGCGHVCRKSIERIPAADVRPVAHGHWKHEHLASTSGGTYEVIRCSECGWAYPMFETAYCPCCGTDMRPREVSE